MWVPMPNSYIGSCIRSYTGSYAGPYVRSYMRSYVVSYIGFFNRVANSIFWVQNVKVFENQTLRL